MSRSTDVKIRYAMVDITAAEDGTISITGDTQSFSDTAELVDDEHSILKWATLEKNSHVLDDTQLLLPEDISSEFMGVWSDEISGTDGKFTKPITMTVKFTDAHTSAGITLIFSEPTYDWCNDLAITWLDADNGVISEKRYYPDSAAAFCENQIENFYGIKVIFYSTNKPYRFLKLTGIKYGLIMNLDGSSLTSCTILEEIDPSSSELSVNTLDVQFYTDSDKYALMALSGAYVLLQERQEVKVTGSINGVETNMGTFYLDKPTTTESIITLECVDLIGTMSDSTYLGGYWPDGVAAETLIAEIMQAAGVKTNQYAIEEGLKTIVVKGYLPISTPREALQQVCFAMCAVADCSRSNRVNIKTLDQTAASIPLERKVTGHTQERSTLVTDVEIYTHHYAKSMEKSELFSERRSAGEYTIQFSSPASNLSVTGATLNESGINYAKITVTASEETDVIITGYTYDDSTNLAASVSLDKLPAGAKRNTKTVTDCTLDVNAQNLAQHLYDCYSQRITDSGQIILSGEKAGNKVDLHSASEKTLSGIVQQLDIDLYGGYIAKASIQGGDTNG